MLIEEMDARGGSLAVVLAGYEKAVYDQVLAFSNGALSSRFRRCMVRHAVGAVHSTMRAAVHGAVQQSVALGSRLRRYGR